VVAKAAETIQTANHHVDDAIETGRQPGMPLHIIAKRVREAPLASQAIAVMLGMMLSRRN